MAELKARFLRFPFVPSTDCLELLVNRLELLVNRLELLVKPPEVLVDRLEILHNHLKVLVNHLKVLVNRLELLVNRLEPLDNLKFGLKTVGRAGRGGIKARLSLGHIGIALFGKFLGINDERYGYFLLVRLEKADGDRTIFLKIRIWQEL